MVSIVKTIAMNETSEIQGAGMVNVTEWIEDRRRTDRVRVSIPLRVCPSDPREGSFEEFSITLNASRDGIYFASKLQSCRVGMSLLVTFPYSPVSPERNVDFVGKVIRIDKLSDGRTAIAVELVTTIVNKQKRRPVTQ
jgi:hypothetical protein